MFRTLANSIRQQNMGRGLVLPVLLAAAALVIAVVGSLFVGADSGVDDVNGFVEILSGRSSSFLGDIGFLAPLGFAFAAGLVSAVNPCGFVMLPAYLGLYLDTGEQHKGARHPAGFLGKALLVSGAMTAGFVLLFGVAGAAIGTGARAVVVDVIPWLGLVIGAVLAVTGSWLLCGGHLYTGVAARAAAGIGNPRQIGIRGYFLFGLAYGVASLSCTLPFFLVAIGTTLAVSSIYTSLGQGIMYALGMGLVIVVLALAMGLFRGAAVGGLSRVLRYVQPTGALLMISAGAYIVFYWLTIGGLP
jgi:cytochrome c biogenesis protein CcdA